MTPAMRRFNAYLGIDPGKSGGAAVISHKDRTSQPIVSSVFAFKDKTDFEITDYFESLLSREDISLIACSFEFVSASPQMGATSSFTFGDINGFLRGVLYGLKISFDLVTPAKWQRSMQCLSGGDKKITRARAQQLFSKQPYFSPPNGKKINITDNIADALLIAMYCSKKDRGLS